MILAFSIATLLCIVPVTVSEEASKPLGTFTSDWPLGDPRRCQEQARQSKMDMKPYEVLPGIGWDNLRNLEAGQVVVYNYTRCQTTADGRFLIPDNVFTVPIKMSEMETFAQMIDEWHNSSSVTSDSINVHAGLSLKFGSISGKFSREHYQMKAKQIEDEAVTVRVQLRYKRYEGKLQPDPVLSPEFKSRLLHIGARVELNQTDLARYEAELVVRDFGTHVLTSVTAGAALVKDDYLKREYVASQSEDKRSILASASASFGHIFSVGADYSHTTDDKTSDMYNKSLTHSYLYSVGGPLALTNNMTVNTWAMQVDPNLVPVDRWGDPLYFFITTATLPELPSSTVGAVEQLVRNAIEIYYQTNVIPGCTKLGSPKFSFSANFDDGTCTKKATNNTFGGVFQSCSLTGANPYDNPCSGLDQVNPKTGQHSCPPTYTAVKIHQASKKGKVTNIRSCRRCGFLHLSHCCHTDQYQATATYETYWCAATGLVPQESGYRFGGVFTSRSSNLVTGDKGCPPGFYARKMFFDMSVCISDDFELDTAFSVPFGGFFSCNKGNPLAIKGVHPVGNAVTAERKTPFVETIEADSLANFMLKNSGPDNWPQRCPEGYSQHLATEDAGCAIHYCVESGALSGPSLPPVKRPPFLHKPAMPLEDADNLVMFNFETQTWMKNHKAKEFLKHVQGQEEAEDSGGLSAGAASGIAIVATLAVVAITTMAVFGYRRRWDKALFSRDRRYRSLDQANERSVVVNPNQSSYGAVSTNPGAVAGNTQEDDRGDGHVNISVEA